ncbi:MAG TPA: hypothetical protein VKB75_06785 [Jatrophihabitans sp.]|nr:hypothetical protein [Jatrophihabitans sp.]
MDANELAQQLLDAQVEYVLAELSGKRLTQLIARDVDDVLSIMDDLTVSDVLKPDSAKRVARRLVDRVAASTLLEELVSALSDAIYDLSASDEYTLGEVVERDPVEALVAKLLSMHQLQDRALEQMAESPLVAAVASKFVTKIVSDFLQQNRQLAERLPGAKSLISFGMGAASRVKNATVDQFLGDAAGKSTQFAIRRTNVAVRELLREAPLQGAAMEIWDLHAEAPISDLREYLSKQELRELALLVHGLLVSARSSEYVGEIVDECVDVFFAEYGARSLASLLPDLGISRDDLVADLRSLVPQLIDAARADGRLEALVRTRLEPFYKSDRVLALLRG